MELNRKVNKVLLLLLVGIIVLLTPVKNTFAEETVLQDFERITENNRYVMYVNKATAEFAVKDKKNSFIWSSNPLTRDKDEFAKGMYKTGLSSQLQINYMNKYHERNICNNFVGSIKKKEFQMEKIENGVKFIFNFPGEKFKVPVQYSLSDDYIKAEIITKEIEETGENRMLDITLLPYFGAGSTEDTGYMLTPDGSGGLIYFNNGKTSTVEYNQPVYGRDDSLSGVSLEHIEDIHMPVFGIKNEDNAFIAIITKGASLASINAMVSKQKTSFNNICSSFSYRFTDTMNLNQMAKESSKNFEFTVNAVNKEGILETRYYLLYGEESNYSGMAAKYRDYLVKEKGLKKNTNTSKSPLYLDVYGAIEMKKLFLGIPIKTVQPLTTFKECKKMLKELKNKGVDDIVLKYNNWLHSDIIGKIPLKVDFEKKLGGKRDFLDLYDFTQKNGVRFYPSVDFIKFSKSRFGYSTYFAASKTTSKLPVIKNTYTLNNYKKDDNVLPYYLLSPERC